MNCCFSEVCSKFTNNWFRHPQLNGDFRSVTSSQTTTDPEDNSFAEGEAEEGAAGGGGGGGGVARPAHHEGGADVKMLDPALLQVLSYAANLNFQEEEDTLGKVSVGSSLQPMRIIFCPCSRGTTPLQ